MKSVDVIVVGRNDFVDFVFVYEGDEEFLISVVLFSVFVEEVGVMVREYVCGRNGLFEGNEVRDGNGGDNEEESDGEMVGVKGWWYFFEK